MNNSLSLLNDVKLNFSADSLLGINLTLAFIMFGVALGIKLDHFKEIAKKPKAVIIGFISQFILLPAITFLLVIVLNQKVIPTIAIGMILVAACPGGNISNFMSSLAKGNAALSVSLTAIATLMAIILTPVNFAFWGKLYNGFMSTHDAGGLVRELEIDTFQMFKTVLILLGIPLILGISFAAKFPKTTDRIIKPIKITSIIAFIAIVILALNNNIEHFRNYVGAVFLLVLIHNAIAFSLGYGFASIFSLPKIDKKAISIETGIQNSGLALVLLFNPKIFPPDLAIGGMTLVVAWWGIWHIISGLLLAGFWSRKTVN
jgi:BASS family bile acid:Na+ symporter